LSGNLSSLLRKRREINTDSPLDDELDCHPSLCSTWSRIPPHLHRASVPLLIGLTVVQLHSFPETRSPFLVAVFSCVEVVGMVLEKSLHPVSNPRPRPRPPQHHRRIPEQHHQSPKQPIHPLQYRIKTPPRNLPLARNALRLHQRRSRCTTPLPQCIARE
jgi:hypothetical protein